MNTQEISLAFFVFQIVEIKMHQKYAEGLESFKKP